MSPEELEPVLPEPEERARSGVWPRLPARSHARRAGWPRWASGCAALVLFVGVAAVALGTLLQLTRELVELGHHRPVAGTQGP